MTGAERYQGFQFFELVKKQSLCRRVQVAKMNNAVLEIVFPEEGKVRSRKIVTRSRARPTGKYPSWKMGRMLQWESVNELNAYRLLDADPAALAYHEQPLTIRYSLNNEVHTHYPDTLVQWGSSRELWEIKPSAQALRPEYLERTKLLEVALPQLGFAYRMVFAEELAKEPRLSNVLSILKYGRARVPESEREQLRQLVDVKQGITWGDVLGGALGKQGRSHVCRLVLEGQVHLNLDEPVTSASTLSWLESSKFVAKAA